MPDGWNTTFGLERFKPGEALFDTTASLTDTAAPPSEQTIPMLVKSALDSCDVDLKPVLMSNILVVGGTSLTQGFNERLEKECMKFWPQRCKVLSPGNVVERKYASWIGGSILASLGSFHQLWVSRQEFEEFGPGIVHRRCK